MIRSDKELNRYSISIIDFEKAIEFLQEAEKFSQDTPAFEALVTAGIIAYCRPFSANELNKKAEAVSKITIESFSYISDKEISLHDLCMKVRNKAIAHSEWLKHPTRRDHQSNIIRGRHYSILSEQIDRVLLVKLARKLYDQCDNFRADYLREQKEF